MSWYKNGKLETKSFYSQENPKLNNSISWYESGAKKQEVRFHEDKDRIITQNWYENGQLKSESQENLKGQMDGFITYWYESGQIESKQEYKKGKTYGLCQNWDEEGKLIAEQMEYNGLYYGDNGLVNASNIASH